MNGQRRTRVVQSRFHGPLRTAERLSGFPSAALVQHPENDDVALPFGQLHESPVDRFVQRRVLGVEVGILLNHGCRLRGCAGEPIPGHAPFHRSQTYSSAHGVEPSQQRSRTNKRLAFLIRPVPHLLQEIVGVVQIHSERPHERQQSGRILVDQAPKHGFVTGPETPEVRFGKQAQVVATSMCRFQSVSAAGQPSPKTRSVGTIKMKSPAKATGPAARSTISS